MAYRGAGLPGDVRTLPADTKKTCDFIIWEGIKERNTEYCKSKANVRIQGETDSFGAEYEYFCFDCADLNEIMLLEYKKEQIEEDKKYEHNIPEELRGKRCCETCKKWVTKVLPTRDPDEGSHGPVYYKCIDCMEKFDRSLQEY